MNVRALGVALLAAVASACVTGPAAAAPAESSGIRSVEALATGLLADVDSLRRARGLAPLRLSPPLAAAARSHSRTMVTCGFFSHASPDGAPFWRRIARFYAPSGYRTWSVGENLAFSTPSLDSKRALRMWLGSPPHRRNLLDPRWREIGISALHTEAAPGDFGGLEVVVLTAAFGVRR